MNRPSPELLARIDEACSKPLHQLIDGAADAVAKSLRELAAANAVASAAGNPCASLILVDLIGEAKQLYRRIETLRAAVTPWP